MTIRVAHIATGNVGKLALAGILTHPDLELTGLYVSSADKVGRDAGELAALDVRTGIAATDDLDAALAGSPQCAAR
jgi:2,4-diaminopentanoate dehydrogenase